MKTSGSIKRSRRPSVIVEIGNDWLKIAQSEPDRDGTAITKVHLERFESFGIALSTSIANAFNKMRFDRVPVIACLPRQLVNIRMLDLPSTDTDEIAGMAEIQVGKQTPYSKEEIVFDYRIVKGGRAGYTRVMMVIVQDNIVRDRFHMLEEAGVAVERMSVTTEGILNWHTNAVPAGGGSGNASLLLDMDSFYSDFAVIVDGGLAFSRSILMGANQLLNGGKELNEKFALEVKRSLEACQGESPSLSVGKLYLAGAGPNVKDLGSSLSNTLAIPVQNMDALRSIKTLPKTLSPLDPAYRGVSLTSIVGTALAPESLEFNLTPESVRLRDGLEKKARSLTAFGMLVMAVLVSLSMYATLKLYMELGHLAKLRAELSKTSKSAWEVEREEAVINKVKSRQDPRFSMVNLLSEIHSLTPENVSFDALDVDTATDQVRLVGSGGARGDVSILVRNLEQSAFFKDAKEDGPTLKDKDTGRYNFRIICLLERKK